GNEVTEKEADADNRILTIRYTFPATEKEKVPEKPFTITDVPQTPGSWKYDSVKYVNDRGIMGGVGGSNQFQPDNQLTRAMFATVLYRMAGEPEVAYSRKFSDVAAGKWYSSAILWANSKGIVQGYSDGSYGINDNITREQIAKMLCLYGEAQKYDVSARASLDSFTDRTKVSDWAAGYMQWAVHTGMISGKPNGDSTFRLDPKGQATRAECAKMLRMFNEKYQ
ncbi:MAG: S-layer homology domain-containing protein, partial [Kineothrix sp.]